VLFRSIGIVAAQIRLPPGFFRAKKVKKVWHGGYRKETDGVSTQKN
jgi:hypothetical protein